MSLRPGSHRIGPDQGTIKVLTYREGVAQMAGHDLIIEVCEWEANAAVREDGNLTSVELEADPRSLRVREGLRGVKPLTDGDRAKIVQEIERKVLGREPIAFRSTAVGDASGKLRVEGQLTIAGSTRPVEYQLDLSPEGDVHGTLSVTQTEFGIKPYRGFMGALRVRDAVELTLEIKLPSA